MNYIVLNVIAGSLTLNLHPRGLEYIAARLSSLGELESAKQRSPVDFFRGCVSDVQDFKRLEKIQHVLHRVRTLRVQSSACKLRCPPPLCHGLPLCQSSTGDI